jgi:hypothetical protein
VRARAAKRPNVLGRRIGPMSRPTLRVRCTAHSSRTGEPCRRWASHGTNVCTSHGARAPAVKRKAEERIRELVNPALAALARLIGDADLDRAGAESEAVRLQAARDILDRAGYSATQKVKIDGELIVETETDRAIREDLRALAQNSGPLANSASPAEGDRPAEPSAP